MTAAPPARPWTAWGKRGADLILAGSLLLLLSPLIACCALAVRLAEGAPVLFRQERVGRGGREFAILKFRTMRRAPGPEITTAGDARITPLGRRLRRPKLDELPQLWNVLRGDMSLVGPRPEVPKYVRAEPRAFRAVTRVRPGMVDWASLIFRDEEAVLAAHPAPGFYERVLLPRKLALARLYVRRTGPLLDLSLLAATLAAMLGARSLARTLVGSGLYDRARRLSE
ncbi:MAG TPA: sugar transferase [Gemmatimonadales bacterium]|nr:sugar transferase [Gemmatimonadales bacterium]